MPLNKETKPTKPFCIDLKVAQINVQYCLIYEFMLWVLNWVMTQEVNKNICVKTKHAGDHIWWFMKFCSGCKNLNDWVRSIRPKTVNSKAVLHALKANSDLNQIITWPLALWVECSPMIRETRVQSQVKSYQRLKKWYLMSSCLTLSIIR